MALDHTENHVYISKLYKYTNITHNTCIISASSHVIVVKATIPEQLIPKAQPSDSNWRKLLTSDSTHPTFSAIYGFALICSCVALTPHSIAHKASKHKVTSLMPCINKCSTPNRWNFCPIDWWSDCDTIAVDNSDTDDELKGSQCGRSGFPWVDSHIHVPSCCCHRRRRWALLAARSSCDVVKATPMPALKIALAAASVSQCDCSPSSATNSQIQWAHHKSQQQQNQTKSLQHMKSQILHQCTTG